MGWQLPSCDGAGAGKTINTLRQIIFDRKFKLKELKVYTLLLCLLLVWGCKTKQSQAESEHKMVTVEFNADSAYAFCSRQCDFGPRTMNSDAHERCAEWIADKFSSYGMTVEKQKAVLRGYNGTELQATNIIATFRPEASRRVLLCAHWDSRPWADNDPDSSNWHKPVMAANDGASGVAVMLEIARLLQSDSTVNVGIDFVCFDAEDWGTPQWEKTSFDDDRWALGSEYWARHNTRKYDYGILLDMVGGQGAVFYKERMSKMYASELLHKVWVAAKTAGYGSTFTDDDGGRITDDHVNVNEIAGIPCIDIIPYYPACEQSSFGPTWHTVSDDMNHIDRNTLKAVGQTLIQMIYEN